MSSKHKQRRCGTAKEKLAAQGHKASLNKMN